MVLMLHGEIDRLTGPGTHTQQFLRAVQCDALGVQFPWSLTAASPSEGLASVNGDMPFGILFVPTPRLWISNPALTWRA